MRITISRRFITAALLILLVSCAGGDEREMSSFDKYKGFISKDADSFLLINFTKVSEAGYRYSQEKTKRGEYFRYIEKMLGFHFVDKVDVCVIAEMNRKPAEFGIDAYLLSAEKECYWVLCGRMTEDEFQVHILRKPELLIKKIQKFSRTIYHIPSSLEGEPGFYLTFMDRECVAMANNERSMLECLETFNDSDKSIAADTDLSRSFDNLDKSATHWGLFKMDGSALPEKYESLLPGIRDIRYVSITGILDKRVILVDMTFHLARLQSARTFEESISKFISQAKRRGDVQKARRDLMSQTSVTRNNLSVTLEFHMTHSHLQLMEKMIVTLIRSALGETEE